MDRGTVVLHLLTEHSLPAINWLKQHIMLKNEVIYPSWDKEMNWTKYAKSNAMRGLLEL